MRRAERQEMATAIDNSSVLYLVEYYNDGGNNSHYDTHDDGGGTCLVERPLVVIMLVMIRPVHKNLFLEFPKMQGRFMLHFDR